MKIVSLEGPDFSGKSTLASTLVPRLRSEGLTVEKSALPTDMITGIFTSLLRNSKDAVDPRVFAMVQAADHLHHYVSTRDLPVDILLLERSALSLYVYQGMVMGVDTDWLEQLNRHNGTVPDLTAVVKVPPDELVRRAKLRAGLEDSFEKEDFVREVAAHYYDLPDRLAERFNVEYFPHGGTERTVELLAGRIKKLL